MARYLGPTCKLSRREGTDLFLKSGVRPLDSKCKAETAPVFMALAVAVYRITVFSYVKSKKFVVSTAFSKSNSVIIIKKQLALKAQRVKTCCSFWKAVWIMLSIVWALAQPVLRRVSWYRTSQFWSMINWLTLPLIKSRQAIKYQCVKRPKLSCVLSTQSSWHHNAVICSGLK